MLAENFIPPLPSFLDLPIVYRYCTALHQALYTLAWLCKLHAPAGELLTCKDLSLDCEHRRLKLQGSILHTPAKPQESTQQCTGICNNRMKVTLQQRNHEAETSETIEAATPLYKLCLPITGMHAHTGG